MYFSRIALVTFVLASLTSAAPVKRNFFTSVANAFNGATFSGVAGTIVQSLENPQLTAARIEVVKSLAETGAALNQIRARAGVTGNGGVATLVTTAQGGVGSAQQGVNNIGAALISGRKPLTADQKQVAVGIKTARDAVNQMDAAVTTADATLSNEIANAKGAVTTLQQGGLNVLSAQGLTFAALGLPDNFAQ